jgi:hypothetical protein
MAVAPLVVKTREEGGDVAVDALPLDEADYAPGFECRRLWRFAYRINRCVRNAGPPVLSSPAVHRQFRG